MKEKVNNQVLFDKVSIKDVNTSAQHLHKKAAGAPAAECTQTGLHAGHL